MNWEKIMNKPQKFFKVYEIIDNVNDDLESYPTFFVGAFLKEKDAINLCNVIDISNCNSTKIIYGEITESDINNLKEYGLQGADEQALLQIKSMLQSKPQTQADLTK